VSSGSFLCFAYGSNMASHRLQVRAPSAEKVAVGWLGGYRLTFDKVSRDGSGKCDCERTDNPEDRVYGVVYRIARADEDALDRVEGLNNGYEKQNVGMTTGAGELTAVVYIATRKEPGLKPYAWYKEHVLRGAKEHSLPEDYVRKIETVEAIPDPNEKRVTMEMAIWEA